MILKSLQRAERRRGIVAPLFSVLGGSWVEREVMELIPISNFLMCGVNNVGELRLKLLLFDHLHYSEFSRSHTAGHSSA